MDNLRRNTIPSKYYYVFFLLYNVCAHKIIIVVIHFIHIIIILVNGIRLVSFIIVVTQWQKLREFIHITIPVIERTHDNLICALAHIRAAGNFCERCIIKLDFFIEKNWPNMEFGKKPKNEERKK